MKKRIYLAGPMTGYADLNFPAFHAEAARLRALGHDVINPAEINGEDPAAVALLSPGEMEAHWRACMRADITALLECDGIAMLPGWEKSRGASLEHHVASALGFQVFQDAP